MYLASLGLHIASAFLLWRLFWKLGLRLAWLDPGNATLQNDLATLRERQRTRSAPPAASKSPAR